MFPFLFYFHYVFYVVTYMFVFSFNFRYRKHKTGWYKVKGLAGGYDNPLTDKFIEFGRDNDVDINDVKKNPSFEEDGL